MAAYYNEIDKQAAQWLRNLIAAGLIAPGDVDDRSIVDVHPNDLRGYTQCHFFAGVGVWSYALRRAGWRDDEPVWTASCPCQPFSIAGSQEGLEDERHLWPYVRELVREHRPPEVLGEQVASEDAESWLDHVHHDLETLDYAFGCIAFPSAGVGAPHIRDRVYFAAGRLAHAGSQRLQGWVPRRPDTQRQTVDRPAGRLRANRDRGPVNGFWGGADWVACRDGKQRPIGPGIEPLVDGAPARVVRARAYGNAINGEAAAQFIGAYRDVRNGPARVDLDELV